MKKEYVKPQNRVVELKDKLLQVIGESDEEGNSSKDVRMGDDLDDYKTSDDIWED